jgi:diguanylate cyclase (GGDEF)-like protein
MAQSNTPIDLKRVKWNDEIDVEKVKWENDPAPVAAAPKQPSFLDVAGKTLSWLNPFDDGKDPMELVDQFNPIYNLNPVTQAIGLGRNIKRQIMGPDKPIVTVKDLKEMAKNPAQTLDVLGKVPGNAGIKFASGLANANQMLEDVSRANPLMAPQMKLRELLGIDKLDDEITNNLNIVSAGDDVDIANIANPSLRNLANIGTSAGEMGLAALTGPLAPVTFAASATGNYYKSGLDDLAKMRGVTVDELSDTDKNWAKGYAVFMGSIEGISEKFSLGKIQSAFTKPFKQALMNAITSMPAEFAQEFGTEIADRLAKTLVIDPDALMTGGKLDPGKVMQLVKDATFAGQSGMVSAGLLGGAGAVMGGLRNQNAKPKLPMRPVVPQVQPEIVQPEAPVMPEAPVAAAVPPVDFESRLRERVGQMNPDEQFQSVFRDRMTGIYNRAAFEEIWNNPETKPSHMAMIDLNGFKHINDKYGHPAGDQVLQALAKIYQKAGVGDVFRMGGDEFSIMANSEQEAQEKIAKLQKTLDNSIIEIEGKNGNFYDVRGITFGHGIGTEIKPTDDRLGEHKDQQIKEGTRPKKRGAKPQGLIIQPRNGQILGGGNQVNPSQISGRRIEPPQPKGEAVSDLQKQNNNTVYLHGTNQKIEKFKVGPSGLVFFSEKNSSGKTQAEYISEGASGGNLVSATIDKTKLKLFDPFDDPIAKKIMEDAGLKSDRSYFDYNNIPDVVPRALKEGYSLFKVWEPSVHDYSWAVANPDAINIIENKSTKPPTQAVSPSGQNVTGIIGQNRDKINGNESGRNRGSGNQKGKVPGTDEAGKQAEQRAAAQIKRYSGDAPKAGAVAYPPSGLLRPQGKVSDNLGYSDKELEQEFKASHGITPPSLIQKIGEFMVSLKNKATREFEHLPRTAEFAQLRNDLLKLGKQKEVSSYKAIEKLRAQLMRLDPRSRGLFERAVFINDLAIEAKKDTPSLPPGFTPEKILAEKRIKDSQVNASAVVKEALELRDEINKSVHEEWAEASKKIGKTVPEYSAEYFHHQVLEYANIKGALVGTGKRIKTPKRGFEKGRTGYQGSINTNYLEAEYEVLAQMIEDTRIAEAINSIREHYDISAKVKAEAKAQELENWRDAIPEGYVAWQPREGHAFYMTDSIPAKFAAQLQEGALEEIGITVDDLRQVLAVGGLRQEFIVKQEVADTLDNLIKSSIDGFLKQTARTITTAFKVNALHNPRRFLKYSLRNVTSDGEWTAIGNPRAFRHTARATKELYNVLFRKMPLEGEFKEWFQRGGMETTLYVQEFDKINELTVFKHLFNKYPDITKIPSGLWKGYWNKAKELSIFRESILRYANYLEYLDQMQNNKEGKPSNFGASRSDEVMAIKDIRDRAFWLSNELNGAYDRVSVMGQEIRNSLIPFWSYQEINFKRYIQYMKNQSRDGMLAMAVGRHFVRNSPRLAYNTGKMILKMSAVWTMLQLFNGTFHPDEEEELPPDVKARPHIIFGRGKDGKIRYFDRLGALGDFLEWFGLDEAPHQVMNLLSGRRTLQEAIAEMAKRPFNKLASGITPIYKTPMELLMAKSLFPDATKPGNIRDRGVFAARVLGLENEYKKVMGLPSRGYFKSLESMVDYSVDPREAAFWSIIDEKERFQRKIGKWNDGYSENQRSYILYNLKMAMRYGDKVATDKYLAEYIASGGTQRGIKQSLAWLDPLKGLNKEDKEKFIKTFDDRQMQQYKLALEFYKEVIAHEEFIVGKVRDAEIKRRTQR